MSYSQKNKPHKTKRMDAEDVKRVLAALETPKLSGIDRRTYKGRRDVAIIRTLAETGMRISEVVKLRLGDVTELDVNGTPCIQLQFAGKGGRERRVILAGDRRQFMLGYLARRPGPNKPDAPLFYRVTRGGKTVYGDFMHRGYVNRLLVDLAQRLGIPKLTPHMFRHSLASRFAEKDVGLFRLMQYFGWTQAQTAQRYVAVSAQAQAELSALGW